jgi:hypothetical protein
MVRGISRDSVHRVLRGKNGFCRANGSASVSGKIAGKTSSNRRSVR